jgi:hypothetical protein
MTSSSNLSIILPAYNAESTIGTTLESTVSLVDAGAELVIIDDGSTDRTPTLVRSFQQSRAHSVVLITQVNQGLSAARNAGIQVSTREWLTFLDADDLLVPGGVTSAITAARASGCRIGKSRIHQFEDLTSRHLLPETIPDIPGDEVVRVRTMSQWLLAGWGGLLGAVFNRELLESMSPVFERVPFGEDLVFTYELSTHVAHYAEVHEVGYMYRTGRAGQMTDSSSSLRLSLPQAFACCEERAMKSSTQDKALLWVLIQRYRLSRARHVVPELRPTYRRAVSNYAQGLRRRLGLSRLELAEGLLSLVPRG